MSNNQLFEIEASLREELGKGASRRLRHNKKVPGVIYGGGKEAAALTFEQNKLAKSLENEAFYSHILNLKIGTESERVVLKDVQRHPYKSHIVHIDFLRVRSDEKITMNVPLHFIGGEKAPGVREGGVISHIETDVEVSCLPDNLPEYIEIDLNDMQLNQIIHLSDLKLPHGVELPNLAQGDDRPLASLHIPRKEEESSLDAAPVAAEVPATSQKGEDKK